MLPTLLEVEIQPDELDNASLFLPDLQGWGWT